MTTKKFRIGKQEIKRLIGSIGGCMATDKITVDGELVGYMYREAPSYKNDSGWIFLSGTEDQAYADNAHNWQIYDVNTIANYDAAILDHLELPIGTALERVQGTDEFILVDG